MTDQFKKEVAEVFDKLFPFLVNINDKHKEKEIKNFIHSIIDKVYSAGLEMIETETLFKIEDNAIQKRNAEIIAWASKNKKDSESNDFCPERFLGGYNQALFDLINFIKK